MVKEEPEDEEDAGEDQVKVNTAETRKQRAMARDHVKKEASPNGKQQLKEEPNGRTP